MKNLNAIAASALEALKAAGADTAAVTATYAETQEFNVDGGEFSLFRTLFDNSLSLTGYQAGKKGSAGINQFDEASIIAAAEGCMASAQAAEPDEAWKIAPFAGEHSFADGATEPDLELLFSRCRELMDDISRDHPSILMEQMIVTHTKTSRVYANTNGTVFERLSGKYHVELMFSAHEGDNSSSFFGSSLTTDDLSRPFIDCGSIRRDLSDVEKQIFPVSVQGKFEGPVLFTPGCFMETLYYALASFTDGGSIFDGTSIWKDSLGETVADSRLTVALAPRNEQVVCGERWTGDGYLSEDCEVIKDGKLQYFLLNEYFANKTGFARTPNTSLGNMVIPAGDKPLSEIISGIEKGLLVSRLSGGEPASSGDFSMVAKNSFLIENGKIGPAVCEVMINGNLAENLKNIRAMSVETECDGSSVAPWCCFDGITISGK